MEESEMIGKLNLFGITRQEAGIYLCLLKHGELTGYEVSKHTGISRSNVYGGLAGLVEQGAAYLIEGSSSKYIPVPMEEFCENRIRYLTSITDILMENAPRRLPGTEGYVTIEGSRHVTDKIHHMLMGAKQRVYLSASSDLLEIWKEELGELVKRGIKIVLITERKPEILSEEGMTLYLSEERKDFQLRLIVDSTHVLTGEVSGRGRDSCLYCAQPNFVNVFKEAMSNEIKLIQLKGQQE